MSDNRRRYRAIRAALKGCYPYEPKGNLARRLNTLAGLVSGIVGFGGTFLKPGVYEKTGPGNTYLGEVDGPVTERVRRLASLLEAASPVITTDNMRGVLWSKLALCRQPRRRPQSAGSVCRRLLPERSRSTLQGSRS